MKNETKVVLRLSSNMIGNSIDEPKFQHKLLLTNKDKLQIFVKFLQVIYHLILRYQKLNYLN